MKSVSSSKALSCKHEQIFDLDNILIYNGQEVRNNGHRNNRWQDILYVSY